MTFVAIFLGVVVGIIIVFYIGYRVIDSKLKRAIGSDGIKIIKDYIKDNKDSDKINYSEVKNVSGLTNIYEPKIREDFNDFNVEQLYTMTETSIRDILKVLETKDIELLDYDKYVLLYDNLKKKIENMLENDIQVKYKDVIFHKHAIKSYDKKNKTATITVSTSLGYYYSSSDKKELQYKDSRKESRFICKFIYVYDESKIDGKYISINCKNCGAPINFLDGGNCSYCNTYIKPINLKAWKIISWNEEK